ncbi:MAG: hypothetical protein KF797_04515 [Flavobacteriales bacterium]|nr:hypothetical protein [Flavobacteriales bacterium]
MSRTERTQEMLAHVAAWKDSGKSRASYCAEHGLNVHTMAYWCDKARRQARSGGFAPVELAGGSGVEVCYPNGVRLVLPEGTSTAQVSAYIRLY